MAFINDLDINITLETKAIQTANLNLPLLLGSRAATNSLVGKYGLFGSVEELKANGFADADAEVQAANMIFSQSPRPKEIMVYVGNEAKSVAEQLDSAMVENPNFYYVIPLSRVTAKQHEAGNWTAAQEKIMIASNTNKNCLDGRNNIREAFLIHNLADRFFEAAWVGAILGKEIGTYTWHYQTPNMVLPSSFSLSDLKDIRKKNGQTISERKGTVYADGGITTGGQFIDIIQIRDWIKTRIEESIFSLMIRKDKIPYDDVGILIIKSELRKVFQLAASQGMIASVGSEADMKKSDEGKHQYKIDIPSFAEQQQNDRASRMLNKVNFSFVVLGSIEKITVNGTVTV